MKKPKISIWYYNPTQRNITLAELDMSIKKGSQVDLLRHNPALTIERVRHSEKFGILNRYVAAGKLIPLDEPIKLKDDAPRYLESKEPIYSKSHSVITIDPNEKDFIDQLEDDFIGESPLDNNKQVAINEKFLKKVDLDGFIDPLADLPDEEP